MARRRSAPRPSASRSSSSGQKSSYSSKARQSPPPQVSPSAPPPAHQPPTSGGGFLSGLAGTMMTGAALGTGSAMAHRAIDSVFSGSEPAEKQQQESAHPMQHLENACQNQAKSFTDCMTANNGDMAVCQFYFDMLQQCKMGSLN